LSAAARHRFGLTPVTLILARSSRTAISFEIEPSSYASPQLDAHFDLNLTPNFEQILLFNPPAKLQSISVKLNTRNGNETVNKSSTTFANNVN